MQPKPPKDNKHELPKEPQTSKPKPSKQEIKDAYDELAAFLLRKYRNKQSTKRQQ